MKTFKTITLVITTGVLLFFLSSCKKDPPKAIPTLSTNEASNITSTTATIGGTISSDGNVVVTARGVCWSTNQSPITTDNKTSDGSGIGSFTSPIAGLTPGGTYYARAFATNSIGTGYGNQIMFTTNSISPAITTNEITQITTGTALGGGIVTSDGGATITAKGICLSTSQNPTILDKKTVDGTGMSAFTSTITEIASNTTYYVRAYATNITGTGYGNQLSFTTKELSTLLDNEQGFPDKKGEIVQIQLNGEQVTCKKIGEKLVYQGDIVIPPTTKGAAIHYESGKWPDNKVFYVINNNLPNQQRVKDAINYFKEKTNLTFIERSTQSNYIEFVFDTSGCWSFIGMIGNRQELGLANWGNKGTVIHEIGHAIGLYHEHSKKGRGAYVIVKTENILDGEAHNFEEKISSINTEGFDFGSIMLYGPNSFSKNGLATITKKNGDSYTVQRSSLSASDLQIINLLYPQKEKLNVTTSVASSINHSSAVSGGSVSVDGAGTVTDKGVCWSTSQNPTIDNNKISNGAGIGSFTSNIVNLTQNTTYYVKAYAINSLDKVFYGNQVSFTTGQLSVATVTTTAATNITTTGATVGGNVTSDGYSTVTEKGIVYSLSQNPTSSDNKLNSGSIGLGAFSINMNGLSANSTYYVRAYAKNSVGYGYGSQVSFTTLPNAANSIVVNSNPSGASIYLNGTNMNAITPHTIVNVNSGNHHIRLYKYGYNEYNKTITLPAGGSVTINADLGNPLPPLPFFTISNPIKNSSLTNNVLTVTGTIVLKSSSGATSAFTPSKAVLTLNGVDQDISVSNGSFSQQVLIKSGENRLRLRANSPNGDTGLSEEIVFYGNFTIPDIQIILRWSNGSSSDNKDVDLHVFDSNNRHTYWMCTSTYSQSSGYSQARANMIPGSNLDFDNTVGFGPETFTLSNSTNTVYSVKVHFYYGYSSSNPTDANIQLILGGAILRTYGPFRFKNSYYDRTYFDDPDCWWNVISFSYYNGVFTIVNAAQSSIIDFNNQLFKKTNRYIK